MGCTYHNHLTDLAFLWSGQPNFHVHHSVSRRSRLREQHDNGQPQLWPNCPKRSARWPAKIQEATTCQSPAHRRRDMGWPRTHYLEESGARTQGKQYLATIEQEGSQACICAILLSLSQTDRRKWMDLHSAWHGVAEAHVRMVCDRNHVRAQEMRRVRHQN